MACGHGSVHCVEARCAHYLKGGVEVEMVVLYIVNQTLEVEQGCMAFVAVVELALDAEFLEHEHTADTEHVFLLDTVLPVAAVELMGNLTVKLRVHVEVGIHQIETHAAYIHTPYMAVYDTAWERHFEDGRLAVGVKHLLKGQHVEILRLVVGNLLAVHRQSLGKVSVAVEETYSGHVDTAVGGFLDIVAGEHTEAAGVDFKGVAQAVLHREVAYRGDILAHGHLHVGLEVGIHFFDTFHELGILEDFLKTLEAQLLQKHHGVFADGTPKIGIEITEKRFALAVPYPPKVA